MLYNIKLYYRNIFISIYVKEKFINKFFFYRLFKIIKFMLLLFMNKN